MCLSQLFSVHIYESVPFMVDGNDQAVSITNGSFNCFCWRGFLTCDYAASRGAKSALAVLGLLSLLFKDTYMVRENVKELIPAERVENMSNRRIGYFN